MSSRQPRVTLHVRQVGELLRQQILQLAIRKLAEVCTPDYDPDLTLSMSCETAHRFFLGTLDLTKAIVAREISSKGSLLKMLELRALLQRAREIYRQIR